VTVVVALSLIALALSAAVAGPKSLVPAEADWVKTHWVAPGDDNTVSMEVDGLPRDTKQATFQVVVTRASKPTKVAVCAGRQLTDECRRSAQAPARSTSFTATFDFADSEHWITVHSSVSKVHVTIVLVEYTTPEGTVRPSRTPTSPSPGQTSSEEPTISETSVTAEPPKWDKPGLPPMPTAGWPGPTNTGVPKDVTLTVVDGAASAPGGTYWSGVQLTVVREGVVLDGLEIRGIVRVESKNVVIKNCVISGRKLSRPGSLLHVAGSGSVTVQDSELYAAEPSVYVDGVVGQNFTLERVNLHDTVDHVKIIGDNVTIRDSWLHANLHYSNDPAQGGGATHDDNIQIQRGNNLNITRNTLQSATNAAIQVTQDMGVVSQVVIDRNLVGGGACSFNLAEKDRGTLTDFALRANRFTRTSKYNCAIIVSGTSRSSLTLSDNRWVDWTGSMWAEQGIVTVRTY